MLAIHEFLRNLGETPTVMAPKGFGLELFANLKNFSRKLEGDIDQVIFHKSMLYQAFNLEEFNEIANSFELIYEDTEFIAFNLRVKLEYNVSPVKLSEKLKVGPINLAFLAIQQGKDLEASNFLKPLVEEQNELINLYLQLKLGSSQFEAYIEFEKYFELVC